MKAVQKLRDSGIAAELYPDAAKMKKQMNYANRRGIPFVVLAGEEEMNNKVYGLKDMISGDQNKISLEAMIEKLT